jgi:hypothetical protein
MAYITPAQWARVEQLYFEGELKPAEIAKTCGVSIHSMRARARAEGWPRHRSLRLDGAHLERARLRRIIRKKLELLESRMEGADTLTSSADSERQTKEISALHANSEKLRDRTEDWRGAAIGRSRPVAAEPAAPAPMSPEEANQWRMELAERVKRLAARGRDGARPSMPVIPAKAGTQPTCSEASSSS